MAIYKVVATTETNQKYRLIAATNKAQALAHVTAKLFTVEACDPEEVAAMFVEHGVTAVEKAGSNGE